MKYETLKEDIIKEGIKDLIQKDLEKGIDNLAGEIFPNFNAAAKGKININKFKKELEDSAKAVLNKYI